MLSINLLIGTRFSLADAARRTPSTTLLGSTNGNARARSVSAKGADIPDAVWKMLGDVEQISDADCTTNWIRSSARKHELRTRRGLHDFEPQELDALPFSSPAADLCLRDECAIVTNWMKQHEDGARLLEALEGLISTDENPTTSAIGRAMGCSRSELEKIVHDVRSRARMRFLQ